MKKRLFSIIAILALCLALLSVTALAASDPGNYVFDISEGSVYIVDGSTTGMIKVQYARQGESNVYTETADIDPSQVITVTGSFTGKANYETDYNLRVLTSTPVKIKASDLKIDNAGSEYSYAMALVNSSAKVTLILEGENYFAGGEDKGGIVVGTGRTLTIEGTGSVTAKGGIHIGGAGIGGEGNGGCGTIIINSGTVIATGCDDGAGIGGGKGGNGGDITINGGTVTATGGSGGKGIGGGSGSIRQGAFSTGTNGSAVIFASSIGNKDDQSSWSGIVFEGNEGKVYGNQTLTADLTIPEGKTLTIEDGQTLTIPANVTLTNKGTITNSGTLTNYGTIANGGTINGTISDNQPIRVASAPYLDAGGIWQTCDSAAVVTANDTAWSGGWYVVNETVTIGNAVAISGDIHLILADDCTLTVTGGIQGDGNLTIYAQSTGDSIGKLIATGGNAETKGNSCGIQAGCITVNGGDINATGGEANGDGSMSCGISADNGITINGGAVTANGGTVGGLTPSNGDLGTSVGIYTERGDLNVNGGTVIAAGAKDTAWSFGIYVDSYWDDHDEKSYDYDLNVTRGTVRATGGAASYTGGRTFAWSAGMNISGTLTISDGIVTANGNNAYGGDSESYGIDAGQVIIGGGEVTAAGKDALGSYGIMSYMPMAVSGGTVNATGGTVTVSSSDEYLWTLSYGIYASGYWDWENKTLVPAGVTISGGTVTATGGANNTGSIDKTGSYGIAASGDVTVSSGSLLAQASNSASQYEAVSIMSPENLTLTTSLYWRTSAEGTFSSADTFAFGTEPYAYLEIVDDSTHTLTHTAAKAPTCTEAGNREYWTCSVCGKLFSDANGTTETSAKEVKIDATNEHTPGEWASNSTQHWKVCTVCEAELEKAEHTFSGNTCTECGYTKPSTGSSSSITTKTEVNPDGSVTTTVTNKITGTVTETKTTADGTTGTMITDKDGDVTEIKASVSTTAAKEAGKTGGAVTLPVEVPAAKSTEDAPAVEITVPVSFNSVKVEIPVENPTPGTAAVIVHADGTEEIIKTSVSTENSVVLTLDGSATVKIVDNAKEFVDVHPVNHWASDAVDFVTARGMFTGTGETTFSPNSDTTRAMLMTVLARLDGVDTNGGAPGMKRA